MTRIAILGNSGSGKSTLATVLSAATGAPALDLDSIAWQVDAPGVREEASTSRDQLRAWIDARPNWIVEGCYATLVTEALCHAEELIFLNPGAPDCQANCRARPWEPSKYPSKEAQDRNLPMLLDWVAQYAAREDEFGLAAHRALYESFTGAKRELGSNAEIRAFCARL